MDKIEKMPEGDISKNFEWFDTPTADDEPSRLNSLIFFLLCLIPIFSALAFGAVDTWALGLLSLFSCLIIVFWTADAFFKKELQFSSNLLQLPVLGLILIGLIQLLPLRRADISGDLLSISPVNSLSLASYQTRLAVTQLIIYFIFFAAALVFINKRKRLRKVVLTIIIFGSVMAFFGILQRLASPELIYGFRQVGQAISFASFVNQHHFAAFMELTSGLTLALLFGKSIKPDKRFLLVIAAVLMGIGVVFTGSRGGMLSLTGVIAFIVISTLLIRRRDLLNLRRDRNTIKADKKSFYRNFILVVGGLALILGFFGAVILLGGDESLIRGIGLHSGQQDISNGRSHFWQIALKIFFDYPIFGTGLDSFGLAFTRYDTWNGNYRIEQAHNDYLQILADAGILGFICVASFIYLLFKRSLTIIRKTDDFFMRDAAMGALAGCFGILVHSFFDFPLRTTSNAFFFLLLVVIATVPIKSSKVHRGRK